jgi:hypothetical protein
MCTIKKFIHAAHTGRRQIKTQNLPKIFFKKLQVFFNSLKKIKFSKKYRVCVYNMM